MSACAKCGQVHTRCGGHRKRDGAPCRRQPRTGAPVCLVHGGGAPQVKAAADRRVREGRARRDVETFGLPVEVDPAEALLEEVQRTAGHVAWLSEQVRGIDADDLIWGRTKTRQGRGAEGPIDVTDEAA